MIDDISLYNAEAREISNKIITVKWIVCDKLRKKWNHDLTELKLQQGDTPGNVQYWHWFLLFVREEVKVLDDFFFSCE
jgi:hypothetical protein